MGAPLLWELGVVDVFDKDSVKSIVGVLLGCERNKTKNKEKNKMIRSECASLTLGTAPL